MYFRCSGVQILSSKPATPKQTAQKKIKFSEVGKRPNMKMAKKKPFTRVQQFN
jgi:hypothetical protein